MPYCIRCEFEFAEGKNYCKICGDKLELAKPDNHIPATDMEALENVSFLSDQCSENTITEQDKHNEDESEFLNALPNVQLQHTAIYGHKNEPVLISDRSSKESSEYQIPENNIEDETAPASLYDDETPSALVPPLSSSVGSEGVAFEQEQPSTSPETIITSTVELDSNKGIERNAFIKAASIIAALMVVIGGGYWGYSAYGKKAVPVSVPAKSSATAVSNNQQQVSAHQLPGRQDAEVRHVLETLKQANLSKNIDLFISCYSHQFVGIEQKKTSTLANWKKYDYTSLDFVTKEFVVTQNAASGIVEWKIGASSHETGNATTMNIRYRVSMTKENGSWKIIALENI